MQYAPIALFTYNRADHTQRAVESLLQNAEAKDSDLFIFSDGPKNEKAVEGVRKNREYIHQLESSNMNSLTSNLFRSITIIERKKNWGLANSLIAGITEIVNKYGRIIVVEDDLVLSPYFLKFMNDGLKKYEDDDRVGAISGFVYPVKSTLPNTFFLRYFNCWGWAIWKRSWDLLNLDTKYLLRKLRFKKNEFDVGGCGAYGNLYCQKVGLVNSWWVRLYASLFLVNKLTLHPGVSLVTNEGFDGSGTHTNHGGDTFENVKLAESPIHVDSICIEESPLAYSLYMQYFSQKDKTPTFHKIKSFIRRLLYIDCL